MLEWFFKFLVVYFTAAAFGELFNFQPLFFGDLYKKFIASYMFVTEPVVGAVNSLLFSFKWTLGWTLPGWLGDLAVLWLAYGRIARRFVADEEVEFWKGQKEWCGRDKPTIRDFFERLREKRLGIVKDLWTNDFNREKIKWTIFPLGRLYVDTREDSSTTTTTAPDGTIETTTKAIRYWDKSPLSYVVYTASGFSLLGALWVVDYFWIKSGLASAP